MNKKQQYHKCHLCNKDAIACLSPDMDMKGLCFCEKHKWKVVKKYFDIINKVKNTQIYE